MEKFWGSILWTQKYLIGTKIQLNTNTWNSYFWEMIKKHKVSFHISEKWSKNKWFYCKFAKKKVRNPYGKILMAKIGAVEKSQIFGRIFTPAKFFNCFLKKNILELIFGTYKALGATVWLMCSNNCHFLPKMAFFGPFRPI